MAHRLVTCPETAHLELLEYEDTPCGMLVVACSRFRPACAVECPRTCAARLDRRGREQHGEGERDDDERVAVELPGALRSIREPIA